MSSPSDEIDLDPILAQIPEEDFVDIINAIREGAKTPADVIGFGPEAFNAVEQIALSYYRTRLYDKAALVFSFMLRLNPFHAAAWRGLGACAQATRNYPMAIGCYQRALARNSTDIVSKVYLGECLCQVGQKEEGLKILRQAIQEGPAQQTPEHYLKRASAIVTAGGGIPPPSLQLGDAFQAGAAAKQSTTAPSPRAVKFADMKQNPELYANIQSLAQQLKNGEINLAQVGGFSDAQLDAAYTCACKYVDMDDSERGVQILTWLVALNPQEAKYYQLAGIILHRKKFYAAAQFYYDLAAKLAPDDPVTLIHQGECAILLGERDKGLDFIKQGIQMGAGKSDCEDAMKRGQVLLKQFSR